MRGWVRLFWASIVCVCVVFSSGAAQAQTQTPVQFRVAVILTDNDDSARAYRVLVDALEGHDEVEVIDAERILDASDALDVDREDYRKGARRKALTATFGSIMQEVGVDAMVLIDMISRGKRIQAVVIGPEGDELADIRRSVDSAFRSEDALQRELVDPVLAEIRSVVDLDARRRARADQARQQADDPEETPSRAEAQSSADATAVDAGRDEGRQGALASAPRASDRAFKLTGGGFFGRRTFSAESSPDYVLNHVTPQLGAHVAARLRLAELMAGHSAVFLELEGAWAPYTVAFNAFGRHYQEAGEHISGRAGVVYQQELASPLSVRAALGGEVVSDRLDANPIFTGSRYVNGRLTVGIIYHPLDVFEIGLSGGVMPVLLAQTSGASYGDGARGLGYTGGVDLGFVLSSNVVLQVGYDLRVYQTDFANPTVIDGSIRTQEIFQGATFGLAYGL